MFGILLFFGICYIGFGKETYHGSPAETVLVIIGVLHVILAFGSLLSPRMKKIGKIIGMISLGFMVVVCLGTIFWLAIIPIFGIIYLKSVDDEPKVYNEISHKVNTYKAKKESQKPYFEPQLERVKYMRVTFRDWKHDKKLFALDFELDSATKRGRCYEYMLDSTILTEVMLEKYQIVFMDDNKNPLPANLYGYSLDEHRISENDGFANLKLWYNG